MGEHAIRLSPEGPLTRVECSVCQWSVLVPSAGAVSLSLNHIMGGDPGEPVAVELSTAPQVQPPDPTVFSAILGGFLLVLGILGLALMVAWLI